MFLTVAFAAAFAFTYHPHIPRIWQKSLVCAIFSRRCRVSLMTHRTACALFPASVANEIRHHRFVNVFDPFMARKTSLFRGKRLRDLFVSCRTFIILFTNGSAYFLVGFVYLYFTCVCAAREYK